MSLREFLWDWLYAGGEGTPMPTSLTGAEIVGALVVAGIILAVCWLGLRKAFFRVAERARASRQASVVFGGLIAAAWMIGSLEWAGMGSLGWMLLLALGSTVGTAAYLVWVRSN